MGEGGIIVKLLFRTSFYFHILTLALGEGQRDIFSKELDGCIFWNTMMK